MQAERTKQVEWTAFLHCYDTAQSGKLDSAEGNNLLLR